MKMKSPATSSGLVCFSTMIVPSLVFVYVQVTCSDAETFRLARPVARSTVPLVSLQTRLVSFQPATGVSWMV